MQETFIGKTLDSLVSKGFHLDELSYIVPSRRVGVFLNKEISQRYNKPILAPVTLSIEDYIQELSGLHILSDLDTLPYFYQAYCNIEPIEKRDSFDAFIGWAPTILKDFNEVDRYLVDPEQFFEYLGNYKALDTDRHWSLEANPTQMVTQYLDFWKKLFLYYKALHKVLEQNEVAYQGMAYQIAFAKANSSKSISKPKNPLVFLGLNALNTAESKIIQQLLENDGAVIYWDTDSYFLENSYHEAGKFIRNHQEEWKYYQDRKIDIIGSGYRQSKSIEIISATGNLGMVQAARKYLTKISEEDLLDTAVILADEQLLLPLLNALPDNIDAFNVTMGLSLDQLPISSFFMDLFQLHKESTDGTFYYKNVTKLLESSIVNLIAPDESIKALQQIREHNLIQIKPNDFTGRTFPFLNSVLLNIKQPNEIVELSNKLLKQLKDVLIKKRDSRLELEQLLGMTEVIDELSDLIRDNSSIKDLRTLEYLLRQLLPLKKLDFIGEPVQGLQIMGLLETRALDFKNILMLSVNEGTLPAGKSFGSYIPHEMKRAFDLPTYTEKDSIYAYHFYRLLHRCENATFIYNAESDTLGGGEKSRFLLQLERDENIQHKLTHTSYYHKINAVTNELLEIKKELIYFDRLIEIASKGFSPSALTSYVRNPIDFFSSKILRISDLEDVEEDIALNTMGSIIHEALDKLYQPYQNKILITEDYKKIESQIKTELDLAYASCYTSASNPLGKNKIIYEVSHHYIKKMIAFDKKTVQQSDEFIIKSVEQDLSTIVKVPNIGNVKFHGKVDRVDIVNGVLRIIDYKTGSVSKGNVGIEVDGYEAIITDYQKSKAFQVLMYAYLYMKNNPLVTLQAGIISFKNFGEGFISFGIKNGRSYEPVVIDLDILEQFEIQLVDLITELFDPEIPLKEKEV
ncbi:PD-(D/E)XK nuclease superfamily protein [Nonlabens sp. Hel1_33_55]|uniref:PD-(D/E)XK nuclease family protein n=1 Tax=Nonlabens sp. Hel1_33_55 TaxID=1336802 RepID=UPI000875E1D6|nr:PD-(D/E)XK nuclease family protein [Nonlabens sp. Hel1_33_55]SCY29373.1 PD-(D/E)XK nuclease superfamily protein [Nonlabens sp. Hel1_33_55]